MLEIKTAQACVQIREDLGAAVARYDLSDGSAVFRPVAADASDEFEMACNLMVPWCNRISDGGFYCDDVFYPLSPNRAGDVFPLHGNGFQQAWQVVTKTDFSVTLMLESHSLAPFHYQAEVCYSLTGADLTIDLSVTNLSESRLPYGLGLHPWFLQDSDTMLQTSTEAVVLTDKSQLPVKRVSIDEIPEWDFHQLKKLPKQGFDHCFSGWNRRALISWPSRNLQLSIRADTAFPYCHIYSQNDQADFFCFEPVSHSLNTHNWPDRSLSGLALLNTGESFSSRCVFFPSQM